MANPTTTVENKADIWFVGKLILTIMRVFLGAWMTCSGASHLLSMFGYPPIFPQPLGTLHDSNVMLVALLEVGMFDLVKTVELLVGLALIFNVFVPLALAASLPISYMVFHNSIALNFRYDRIVSTYMSVWCLYMTIILVFANIRSYLPLLKMRNRPGTLADFKGIKDIFAKGE